MKSLYPFVQFSYNPDEFDEDGTMIAAVTCIVQLLEALNQTQAQDAYGLNIHPPIHRPAQAHNKTKLVLCKVFPQRELGGEV